MPATRLDDGFQTIFSFAENPTLKFYEKSVTPPSMNGGEPIDTTTMRNKRLRTMAPQRLKSFGNMAATVSYNSDVFDQTTGVWDMINVNQEITIELPDNSQIQFWGYLQSFVPGENVIGQQPTASIVIVATNQNNDTPPLEVDPQYLEPVDPDPEDPYYDYSTPPDTVFP